MIDRISSSRLGTPTASALMAIVNATSDSFSGDGLLTDASWQERLNEMCELARLAEVAVIDIGAESTRPGAQRVDEQHERSVVEEAVGLAASTTRIPISVDTTRASVADAACKSGASMINDVSGLRADPEIADVAASHDADLVLVHNTSAAALVESDPRLGTRSIPPNAEGDVLQRVALGLEQAIHAAVCRGVSPDRIWIDPGLGFGKTHDENLDLVVRVAELSTLCPRIVVGPSRKSFIGWALDAPPDQRIEGTAAVVALLAERRVPLIRVHDYATMSKVVAMTNAVVARMEDHPAAALHHDP